MILTITPSEIILLAVLGLCVAVCLVFPIAYHVWINKRSSRNSARNRSKKDGPLKNKNAWPRKKKQAVTIRRKNIPQPGISDHGSFRILFHQKNHAGFRPLPYGYFCSNILRLRQLFSWTVRGDDCIQMILNENILIFLKTLDIVLLI